MNLHQLEYMVAVAKYKSFSVAAMEIHVSQSTLSHQIRKLEDELGVLLFIRSPRSVRLTRAGEEFYNYAQRILKEINNSVNAMQEYTTFDKGYIRIGIISSVAGIRFSEIISSFLQKYHGIDMTIINDTTENLLDAIYERNINLAFVNTPYNQDYEIDFYPLVNEHIVALVPSTHPLAKESYIDLSNLSGHSFILSYPGFLNHNEVVNTDNRLDLNKVIFVSDNLDMIQGFVQEGIGIALIGNLDANRVLNENISVVPLRQNIIKQSGLAVPRAGIPSLMHLPPLTKVFRDFTLMEFARNCIEK